ncbi:MAG TPA: sensor domain-containing diguanylate cyclase [Rhodanobacteraceae bacterium]|nr:sensor domain-containing diguanylate cyclase [Rhodanobacteraceae bacterium]
MAASEARTVDIRNQHPLWDERDSHGRRALLTEILAQVSHAAMQGDSLDTVLKSIVDCVAGRLPVTIASIILLNESRTHFVEEVWSGQISLELPASLPWPVDLGAAGRCVQTGQSQLIADVNADPDYVPGNLAVRSEYLVPIRHRKRLHGVLNLESTRSDFFTPEVCAVFEAIAEQIAGAIHMTRLVLELEDANRKLRELSLRDGLTGIANRRCFDERLAADWERYLHDGKPLALLMVDVDCFKALNDALGHLQGDECLRELATLCGRSVRGESDLVARYGGEEIVIILPGCNQDNAVRVAEDLRKRVEKLAMPHPDSLAGPCVTVSIGVGVAPAGARLASADVVIAAAEDAMYAAKARGRNRVVATVCAPDA